MERDATRPTPFLRQVRLRNYKSIGQCHVRLESPLTFLVGRNGAGKSNFLDALHFIADGLRTSLDFAIKVRGGLPEVRRRAKSKPRDFSIGVEIALSDWRLATYQFTIGSQKKGAYGVKDEHLRIRRANGTPIAHYERKGAKITASSTPMPPVLGDRLYLVNAAGLPEFRDAYDALLSMGFYSLNPDPMRDLQDPDAGELLEEDGRNVASVVARLADRQPDALRRVLQYLSSIVPEITDVKRVPLGPKETLQFRQRVEGEEHPWRFYASSMSDGTLRSLGALIAVSQLTDEASPVLLVGIEEPETALHPAAAGALMDALREASGNTQILVTTHSPDLLDKVDVEQDGLLAVVTDDGTTHIAPADEASIEAVRSHLYTAGELLRMDQLQPDSADLEAQPQLDLFAGVDA